MKRLLFAFIIIPVFLSAKPHISFYETPLECGAKAVIGCGARAKPLLLDLQASPLIKEAWLNREGTLVGVVWSDTKLSSKERTKFIHTIFDKHDISYKSISANHGKKLLPDFRTKGEWFRGAEVDSLSMEEAAWIAGTVMQNLIGLDKHSADSISQLRKEIINYIGSELVKLPDINDIGELNRQKTWRDSLVKMSVKYFGNGIVDLTQEHPQHSMIPIETSTITCPYCGHAKTEKMPDDVCVIKYECENCHKTMTPKKGDCCVYCTYGTVRCPSMQ